MALALCIISYALGLLSIDMFCDHYSLVSSSISPFQLNTCSSYYQNAFNQPWYTSLVTAVPILIGVFVMFRTITRTIYDTLSVPVFIVVVGLFIFKINKDVEALAKIPQPRDSTKEGYLRQIAYTHAIMGILLVVLLVLKVLAEKQVKIMTKKNK